MKKVTLYQAKDGSNHATPKACKEHDAKLLVKPAAEAFVASLDPSAPGFDVIHTDDDMAVLAVSVTDLAHFIVAHADALRKVLTEPLIVRRPRKTRSDKGGKVPAGSPAAGSFA